MNQSSQPLITMDHVGLFYKAHHIFNARRRGIFWALKDVSLEVFPGETLGVIGRNGAGKSTLLKVAAGILAPDRGRVTLSTRSVALLSLQVGFVPHLTGRENIMLSGLLLGMSRKTIRAQLDEIISFAELEAYADQPIYTYSTGMRARLGFAAAFQIDPDILLIDETLGVGDAAFRVKSNAEMKKRITSSKTVLLVSHQPGVIEELCDRVVWIENGETRLIGAPHSVLDAYHQALELHRTNPSE